MSIKSLIKKLVDAPEVPVSEIDQFLQQFDAEHPEKSASQQQEIAKDARIAKLRDLR